MIRILAAIAGLVFAGVALLAFITGAYTYFTEEAVHGPEHEFHLEAHGPQGGFKFDGLAGNWDVGQLQRGSLLGLPQPEIRRYPRSRAAWLLRGAGEGRGRNLDRAGYRSDHWRGDHSTRRADRLFPLALSQ